MSLHPLAHPPETVGKIVRQNADNDFLERDSRVVEDDFLASGAEFWFSFEDGSAKSSEDIGPHKV